MRKLLKGLGVLLAVLGVSGAALFGYAWWNSERAIARVYTIDDDPLPALDAAALERGRHLYVTRGCSDCHRDDGRGGQLFDAGPVALVNPSNLTPAGLQGRYDAYKLAAAIRHGVRDDGRALIFMPSGDYEDMSDDDVAALAAYVLSLPPVAELPPPSEVRPLGRVLHLLGRFPLLPAESIDHRKRHRNAPDVAPNAQYGFYLAQVCTGCHGQNFAGTQPGPGAPFASDLRPGASTSGWQEADFIRAMREGKRPDGSAIDPFMPWQNIGRMTDVELRAIWAYLQTLPKG